jgi:hypothetical protein
MSSQKGEITRKVSIGDLFSFTHMSPFNMQEVTVFGICIGVRRSAWDARVQFVNTLCVGGEIFEVLVTPKDDLVTYSTQ